MRRILVATATLAVAALAAAGASSAARTQDTIICGGETLTLTVTSTDNDGIAWGVGTLSGGTHLIPVSFSFTATDLTTNTVLFTDSQSKGNGSGMHNQATITCTGVPEQGTAGEFGFPDVDPNDVIEFTFTVTAVLKP